MTTPTPIPFPKAGWARHRLKPLQRSRSLMERLKAISPPKKKTASSDDMRRLHKHFAKG